MMTPNDYRNLYDSAQITREPKLILELDYVCRVIIAHQPLYKLVGDTVGIPWSIIACLHYRESDQNFTRHLHNGDPLTARTFHVPMGRPVKGSPPFSWSESAIDALSDVWRPKTWDLPGCLEFAERYNGTGYQKHGINTPYLWDSTDKYTSGLFTKDGSFDPAEKESRLGIVSILKTLLAKGMSLDFSPHDSPQSDLH